MKKIILAYSFILFMTNCRNSGVNLVVIFENIDYISDETKVICKGNDVGKIIESSIFETDSASRAAITIKLSENFNIPTHSTFRIKSIDLFGTKAIEITLTNENQFYQNGDTIFGKKYLSLEDKINKEINRVKEHADTTIHIPDSVRAKIIIRELDSLMNNTIKVFKK